MVRSLVLIPLLYLLAGCDDSGNDLVTESLNLPLATAGKTSYAVGEPIAITATNYSDSTIYLLTCCDKVIYYLDRMRDDGPWQVWSSSGIECKNECFPGGPQNLGLTCVSVVSSSPYELYISSEIDLTGTYRFRFQYQLAKHCVFSPEHQELTSNSFTVE